MVTPKQSQDILVGCIDWALNLIVDKVIASGEHIKSKYLREFLFNEIDDDGFSSIKLSRLTYDLKRQNYIEIDDGDCVNLTNKAKIKIIDKIAKTKKPDNKRRIVSFDIPETKRSKRNGFRRALKNIGFSQIQKSLWICDRNVGELVDIVAKEFKVERYVAYFVIESSNIDDHISRIINRKRKQSIT